MHVAPLIVELGLGDANEAALVGGKALGLERLLAAGLPCPPAFCVTTAALERYLAVGGLRARLTALLDGVEDRRILRDTQALAFTADLSADLAAALTDATQRLRKRLPGAELLAVRSSAAGEDGDAHSFAGLHETVLGVTAGGVEAAVRKCWASVWARPSIAYRRAHGLALGEASMAVVVQVLVPAAASAVVFTANPITGAADEVLVHTTPGLGATLMDNEITPDTAVLSKPDLALMALDVGEAHLRVDARPLGGLMRSRVDRREPAVSEAQLRDLARLALAVEEHFGAPVDIEAAFDGRWHLIQARPITTLGAASVA